MGDAYNATVDLLERNLARPDRPAFRQDGKVTTYGALCERANRAGNALKALGVQLEQRVLLCMLDTPDLPAVFWGAMKAGLVPVPVNTLLTTADYEYLLRDSRARVLVVSAALLPKLHPALRGQPFLQSVVVSGGSAPGHVALDELLAQARPELEPAPTTRDDVAFWLYSSGSTGQPKGAMHLHGDLAETARLYGEGILGMRPDDLVFSAAKLFFAYGLGNSMTFPMAVGAASVLFPDRPTPEAVLATMQRFQPTIFAGVPTLYAALLAQNAIGPGAGSDRLRRSISAGEPLPEHIGRRWCEVVGTDILDGLGSTEMLHIFLSNRPDDIRYGTTGKAVPGYEVRIVTEAGEDAVGGESGELIVKGPSAAEGYWNQRDKSRRTFRGEWTYTGDTYTRDADGYYRYCGRSDDMLKVSGIWVSPFEVEEALIGHPAVLESAVVGHPDPEGLIKPKAFVVLQQSVQKDDPGALCEALQNHVKEKIGVWKYPRWIEFCEGLPKTATGKIQRYKLRQ